jgi:hypothetical protein
MRFEELEDEDEKTVAVYCAGQYIGPVRFVRRHDGEWVNAEGFLMDFAPEGAEPPADMPRVDMKVDDFAN